MIWLNAVAAGLAMVVSMWVAIRPLRPAEPRSELRRPIAASTNVVERSGQRGLLDRTGNFVPIRPYRRIVSGSTVSDDMLLALSEPTRILRFSKYSVEHSPFRYRYAGKGTDDPFADVEALIALEPDLVLVHDFGTVAQVARLREAGITVFDFGEMRGSATLVANLRALGVLLGRAERGAELAARFERRLHGVRAGLPRARWPRGLYVAVHGDDLYGGTDGSSYHDVLTAAGVLDIAAEGYDEWPAYGSEDLLKLDPDLIVTNQGMRRLLCRHPGFERLRACRAGKIVELDGVLLSSPGLDMLEAAEALFEAVHGEEMFHANQ